MYQRLLFSDAQYLQAPEAYLRVLERRLAAGQDLDLASVASLFVSRRDKAADPLLPAHLHARLGLTVAKKACGSYRKLVSGEHWAALVDAAGVKVARM
jgi:transaldolase